MLCLLLAMLAGCSALRLGYNQADTFVYFWADRYVDFDDTQSPKVRDAISAWFAWNRRTQLPDYAELLKQAESEILGDATPERTCGWWTQIRARLDRAAEQTIPAVAEIAMTLKPVQLQNIEKRYAKTNKEWRDDFLQSDSSVRLAEAVKRAISRYEFLYGNLDAFQKERLERWTSESPFDPQTAFEERRRRQQDALQVLQRVTRETDPAVAQQHIRGWVKRFDPSPNETYRQLADRVIKHNCRAFSDLHNSMSAEQRQNASKRFRQLGADMRALAAERGD
jgi:hypothetical protein